MYARRCNKKDPLHAVIWSRAGGRCEATRGEWGDPLARRCDHKAEDVFLDQETDHRYALCEECRKISMGLTSDEKGKRINANKESQQSLLAAADLKIKPRK